MSTAAILAELHRIEQLSAPPSAYYVNADDYAALLATCPEGELPSLDGVRLVPSKDVPRGAIWPMNW
jgi:hypothetical protein